MDPARTQTVLRDNKTLALRAQQVRLRDAAVAVHGIDDKPYAAVMGVSELRLGHNKAELASADGRQAHHIRTGDVLSIHGQTGEVFAGSVEVLSVAATGEAGEKETVRIRQA